MYPNDGHSDFGVKEIQVILRCQSVGQTGLALFDGREGSIKICKLFTCGEAVRNTRDSCEIRVNNLEVLAS